MSLYMDHFLEFGILWDMSDKERSSLFEKIAKLDPRRKQEDSLHPIAYWEEKYPWFAQLNGRIPDSREAAHDYVRLYRSFRTLSELYGDLTKQGKKREEIVDITTFLPIELHNLAGALDFELGDEVAWSMYHQVGSETKGHFMHLYLRFGEHKFQFYVMPGSRSHELSWEYRSDSNHENRTFRNGLTEDMEYYLGELGSALPDEFQTSLGERRHFDRNDLVRFLQKSLDFPTVLSFTRETVDLGILFLHGNIVNGLDNKRIEGKWSY